MSASQHISASSRTQPGISARGADINIRGNSQLYWMRWSWNLDHRVKILNPGDLTPECVLLAACYMLERKHMLFVVEICDRRDYSAGRDYHLQADIRASLVAQLVGNLPAVQETLVQFLGWEDPLEKGMATHSSSLGSSMDREWASVHGFAKSQWTQFSNWSTTTTTKHKVFLREVIAKCIQVRTEPLFCFISLHLIA